MSQEPAVLFANEAFYLAFTARDLRAMDEVWAKTRNVTCIHPGWPPLAGRDAVIGSWADILTNSDSPAVQCSHAQPMIVGDAAYVICHEVLDQGALVATNIFVREDGGWKMVHHQAAPSPPPEADEPQPSRTVQ